MRPKGQRSPKRAGPPPLLWFPHYISTLLQLNGRRDSNEKSSHTRRNLRWGPGPQSWRLISKASRILRSYARRFFRSWFSRLWGFPGRPGASQCSLCCDKPIYRNVGSLLFQRPLCALLCGYWLTVLFGQHKRPCHRTGSYEGRPLFFLLWWKGSVLRTSAWALLLFCFCPRRNYKLRGGL